MRRSLLLEKRHHPGEVCILVGPNALLLRTSGQIGGLEVIAYRFGSKLPAVAAVVGVSERVKHGEVDTLLPHPPQRSAQELARVAPPPVGRVSSHRRNTPHRDGFTLKEDLER